jgi:hypothetical protein
MRLGRKLFLAAAPSGLVSIGALINLRSPGCSPSAQAPPSDDHHVVSD